MGSPIYKIGDVWYITKRGITTRHERTSSGDITTRMTPYKDKNKANMRAKFKASTSRPDAMTKKGDLDGAKRKIGDKNFKTNLNNIFNPLIHKMIPNPKGKGYIQVSK